MTTKLKRADRIVLALALGAACLSILARLIAGPPGAIVHVRWAASVDEGARRQIEARLTLTDGESLGDGTWRYDLRDSSSANIRRLVGEPAVQDTQHIDRSRFAVGDADRTARRTRFDGGSTLVAIVDRVTVSTMALAVLGWLFISTGAQLQQKEQRLRPYVLLALLGTGVYALALVFPPTNGDDLGYLTSITTIGNPLVYFISDHGHGNGLYRPLTPFSMWIVYQVFGVWALPNQLLNLALHLTNVFLLYRIVRRVQRDQGLALLAAAVFMVSQYTMSAATWTSDRPMGLAGLALLLLIGHLTRDIQHDASAPVSFRIPYVLACSVLALLSKESGLVVPLVALAVALVPGVAPASSLKRRLQLAAVVILIVGVYVVWRVLFLGPQYASYSQDGFMFFGLRAYENSNDLPSTLRYLNYGENVLKNLLAPVLPIIGERGALLSWESFLPRWPLAMATAVLCALAFRRRPNQVQSLGLMILVISAVVHYTLFRLRLHYLSQAGFCIFVGSAIHRAGSDETRSDQLLASKALATVVLLASIVTTSVAVNGEMANRLKILEKLRTEGAEQYGQVGESLLDQY